MAAYVQTRAGDENIVVLNDNYLYEASQQAQLNNARWVDLTNVMSVKRDKTIYAIRARNTYSFTPNVNQTVYFANNTNAYTQVQSNVTLEYNPGVSFRSNIYRNFNTDDVNNSNTQGQNILMTGNSAIYGNLAQGATMSQLGICGSLNNTNFRYSDTNLTGNVINVSPNVYIYGNSQDARAPLAPWATLAFSSNLALNSNLLTLVAATSAETQKANINANGTCFQQVSYTNWNRVINANINANLFVNASTDPCDLNGNPVNIDTTTGLTGNVLTNEAYRHQFRLRANTQQTASSNNPIYIARVSRFGKSLSDNKNNAFAGNLALHSFTSNFFASLPSDNQIYAGQNLVTGITLNGNITSPGLVVFNSNFTSGNLFGFPNPFNGNRTDNLLPANNNSLYMSITQNSGQSADYIAGSGSIIDQGGNINAGANFSQGDRFAFVQANVYLNQGYLLMDRISFNSTVASFDLASNIFSGNNGDPNPSQGLTVATNYSNLWISANLSSSPINQSNEVSAKYLQITGSNIIANNWQSQSLLQPNTQAIPSAGSFPTFAGYEVGDTLNLYLRRGSLSFQNRTYVQNATLTGVPYGPQQVPGFITGLQWLNNGNIVLNSNILENNASMTNFANAQIQLPVIVGANTRISANVACNYQIVVSGNVSEENRVSKNGNIVAPQNTANSFIANAWCYDNNGAFVGASGIKSNVIINYGGNTVYNGINIQGLDLNSADANTTPQYTLVFGNTVGSTNSPSTLTSSNFVFFANVFSDGKYTPNVTVTSPNVVMNNTPHLANLLIRDVAYSSFDLGTNSFKFTDDYGVLPISVGSNFAYAHYLPEALVNSNTSTEQLSYKSSADSYLNIITDYNVFNVLPGSASDVHQVTLYDFKYRYGVEQIKNNNGSFAPTQQFINGAVFDPSTNFLINNSVCGVTRDLTGNMEAPAVSAYVYENVNASFNYDAAFPFVLPNSQGVVPVNGTLFPGWKYLTTGSQTSYNGNNPSPDFVIPANTDNLQKVRFHIHSQVSQSQTNGTPYMVASMSLLQNGVAVSVQQKSIEMYPVVHGKNANGALNYATPVVCGVANGGTSYSDYVILMVELVGNNGVVGGTVSVSLPPQLENSSTIIRILPTTTVNNVVRQQVSFSASLRSFPSGLANPLLDPVVNNNWNYLTPLLTQANSVDGGPGSGLTVNIFRQPSNSAIFSYVYSQTLPQELMSFTRTDYYMNGLLQGYNAGPSSTTFAASNRNNSNDDVSDVNYPSLPLIVANSSRYYLDNNAVYVDVSNLNNSNVPLGVLNVARSIEWTLLKGSTQVGRGLISRDPTTSLTVSTTYTVYENFALSSGFVLNINTNITNLASRLLLQKLTTNVNAQSSTQWTFNTKADSLNLTVLRMDGTSQDYYSTILSENKIKQATLALTSSNSTYDIGSVLGGISNAGKFISLTIRPIRGFNFNPLLNTINLDSLVAASTFSISLQPDSYAVAWVDSTQNATTGGSLVNGRNVLFSENNKVQGTAVSDFVLSFNSLTLASQFASTTAPTLSTSDYALIATYQYNGYGQISYSINDFTSNYNNQLKNLTLSNTGNRNPLGDPTLNEWKVPFSNAAPTVVNIKYDGARYYFEIGTGNTRDTVYFKKTNDLPFQINNKTTLLLYSGLRPIMLNVLEVGTGSTPTLQNVISAASLLKTSSDNIFTTINPSTGFTNIVNNNRISTQNYQVVLTNTTAAGSILYRSNKYAPTYAWFTNSTQTKNFFGAYVSSSQLFEDLVITVSRSNNYTTQIPVAATLDSKLLANPQLSDDQLKLLQNGTQNQNSFTTYNVRGTGSASTYGQLFNMNVLSALSSVDDLVLTINPATLTVYAASDSNNNGEIDTNTSTGAQSTINGITSYFGLQNMFSELMFNLPTLPSATDSNVRNPYVVASWALDRNYNSIPGCPFDIQMNNRWSVGYNLDCLFTIQNNNCAQFDVITIATKLTTNASGAVMNGLVVNQSRPLIIRNPTDWARALDTNNTNPWSTEHSGLTFKLNTSKVVQAGSVVRLFVDNVISNNWLEWNVKTAGLPAQGKSFKINFYDQTNYATLLNEQLNISNNFI